MLLEQISISYTRDQNNYKVNFREDSLLKSSHRSGCAIFSAHTQIFKVFLLKCTWHSKMLQVYQSLVTI